MGFCMTCTTTGKNCSYSAWYEQRVEIIKVTIAYLEAQIEKVQQEIQATLEEDGDDDKYINGFHIIDYDMYIKDLRSELIEPIRNAIDKSEDESSTKQNPYSWSYTRSVKSSDVIYDIVTKTMTTTIKEAMVCFGIYGLHLLCKQSDCSGAYSVGESYDILELLRRIKPYFDTSSEIYSAVYTMKSEFSSPIYDIFYDSVSSFQPVRIT
jgi:hypothetical protein